MDNGVSERFQYPIRGKTTQFENFRISRLSTDGGEKKIIIYQSLFLRSLRNITNL